MAREYIRLALKRPDYYRHILAMTFTNKSTQEMKDRILQYLSAFAKGESNELALEIVEEQRKEGIELGATELKRKSQEILDFLLHHYAEFSISTIDAFFQRIIRSFTRETGLLGNFRLEVDNSLIQEEVIALLMEQLKDNMELRGWVFDYSMEKLMAGIDWDVRNALLDFAKLLEKEEFKQIEDGVLQITDDKTFFKTFRAKLNDRKYAIEKTVFNSAKRLLTEFDNSQLGVEDFTGKSKGIYPYIKKLLKEVTLPTDAVAELIADPDKWAHKSSANFATIKSLAHIKWQLELKSTVDFIEANLIEYHSIQEVTRNLYSFGLLSDILRTQRKYLSDENLMLLSDAPQFLNKLMQEQDTSFIYEKVGSFYRHFLLDEFQDTSGLQWKNLLPLIHNGIAQNYSSLIVGDIKQSIYRWRGGDLTILQQQLTNDVSKELTTLQNLDSNYRSNGNIVAFNNAVFETAPTLIATETGSDFPKEAYHDALQKIVINESRGFVRIQFLEPENDDASFEDQSLLRLPALIEQLQDKGVAMKDIAFIVRDNKEGRAIANRFMELRTSDSAKKGYRYDVVSNESLMIDNASCVQVLLNALRIIGNEDHQIARAHLAYEYQQLWPAHAFAEMNDLFTDSKTQSFSNWIPNTFFQQRERLSALPLFEIVENLILIFNLGTVTNEVVYLQSFQDLIQEFSQREKNDVASFLAWWELNRDKKSIQVAGGVDAAQIITIHKAKGLQFNYVIIPFLDWKLDHKKEVSLWCQSDHPLFKQAGFIPVRYVASLTDTVFKDAYQEEKRRIFLDNLNLLYVAFTRAELGLIAFAPNVRVDAKKVVKMTHVGQLVYKVIEKNSFLQSSWLPDSKTFEIGEMESNRNELQNSDELISLRTYSVTPWRDRLQIRTRGTDFFSPTKKRVKINYGIFLHALLAQVKTKIDIPVVINNALSSGKINEHEKTELREAIEWVVDLPILQPFFDRTSICKTEASLFAADGTERRIDRVAMQGDYVCVVDYKTGSPSSKDEAQVKDYLGLLVQMGWTRATAYVIYIEERKWVEVN